MWMNTLLKNVVYKKIRLYENIKMNFTKGFFLPRYIL